MKEIDHDPQEPKRRWKVPEHDKWVQKEYPDGATPKDFLNKYLPLFFVVVALYFSRHGWPF